MPRHPTNISLASYNDGLMDSCPESQKRVSCELNTECRTKATNNPLHRNLPARRELERHSPH